MSAPDQGRTGPTAPDSPTVSTAPAGTDATTPDVAPEHRWWSSVPRHLGRARTSTVILGVLFVAVFALWLNVRPPTDGTPRPPREPVVDAPVVPGLPEETEQAEETEPTAPATTVPGTTSAPAPTTEAPTRTESPTTTGEPDGTTTGTSTSTPADDLPDETAPDSPTG